MAKVTTSENGIQTTTVIEDKKPPRHAPAPPLEMKAGDGAAPPVVDGPESKDGKHADTGGRGQQVADAKVDAAVEGTDGIDPEDREELAKPDYEKERRRIGKYVARLKAEQAIREKAANDAAESERFAEQLFNEREEWRKKAESAEAKAAQLEAQKPKEAELVAPKPEDAKYKNDKGEFDWLKFSTDNADFAAKKAIAEDRKAQADAKQRETEATEAAAFQKRLQDAEAKHPGWLKKIEQSGVELPHAALEYIKQSDYGPDIALYLVENAKEAGRIKELHPIRAVAELGKIELSLTKPAATSEAPRPEAVSQAASKPGAPAPITPIQLSGSNPPPLDPAKMDFKQLRAFERERAREARRR